MAHGFTHVDAAMTTFACALRARPRAQPRKALRWQATRHYRPRTHSSSSQPSSSSPPRSAVDDDVPYPEVVESTTSTSRRAMGPFRASIIGNPMNTSTLSGVRNLASSRPLEQRLTQLHYAHSKKILKHFEQLTEPLDWEEELCCRVVTSKSAAEANIVEDAGLVLRGTHNTKLAFLGRRMLQFCLTTFLATAPRNPNFIPRHSSSSSIHLNQRNIDMLLDAKTILGPFVGRAWKLEEVMRWREVSGIVQGRSGFFGTGLYAARGQTVEAIIGAIMLRHGARLATAVFHSLVLPHLKYKIGPEFEVAIEAVRLRDQELGDSRAGLGSLEELEVVFDHVQEQRDSRVEGKRAVAA